MPADETVAVDAVALKTCLAESLGTDEAVGEDFSFDLADQPVESYAITPDIATYDFGGLINMHIFADHEAAQAGIADVEEAGQLGADGSHNAVWASLTGEPGGDLPEAITTEINTCVDSSV